MNEALIKQGEWVEIKPMVFQRACIGSEHSASYNQNIADGHTELSFAVPFSISKSMDELVTACKHAWFLCRSQHPEIAIELSTDLCIPQLMTYKYLSSLEDAETEEWMDETFRIVKDRSYQDVLEMTYSHRLTTRGKRAIMWLVLDTNERLADSQKCHCLILNASHAPMDFFSMTNILDHYLAQIVKGGDNVEAVGSRDAANLIKTLPVNPINVYDKQYKPTQGQIEEATSQAMRQLSLYKEKMGQSVALYPEHDYQFREHGTECLLEKWSRRTSNSLLSALKEHNVGITYAGAAALVLATYELFGKGHETGALLGMTRTASRWITTIAIDSSRRAIVPNTSDVMVLWIPFPKDMRVNQFNRRELLLYIGKRIKEEVAKHLQSPHYLAAVPYMCDLIVQTMHAQKTLDDAIEAHGTRHGEDSANLVGPSAPGFSPQGVVKLDQQYTHGDTMLERHDLICSGRQIGHSPWIGMYTLDGRLRFTVGYDCKYYKRETMTKFLDLYQENLGSAIDSVSTSPLSVTSQL
jgi:hypothetical protein